jgi:hypothetical protein
LGGEDQQDSTAAQPCSQAPERNDALNHIPLVSNDEAGIPCDEMINLLLEKELSSLLGPYEWPGRKSSHLSSANNTFTIQPYVWPAQQAGAAAAAETAQASEETQAHYALNNECESSVPAGSDAYAGGIQDSGTLTHRRSVHAHEEGAAAQQQPSESSGESQDTDLARRISVWDSVSNRQCDDQRSRCIDNHQNQQEVQHGYAAHRQSHTNAMALRVSIPDPPCPGSPYSCVSGSSLSPGRRGTFAIPEPIDRTLHVVAKHPALEKKKPKPQR